MLSQEKYDVVLERFSHEHAQPGWSIAEPTESSQLFEDDSKLPDISLTAAVAQKFVVAEDALVTACTLLHHVDAVPLFSIFNIVRPCFEAAAYNDWILNSGTFKSRVKKFCDLYGEEKKHAEAMGFIKAIDTHPSYESMLAMVNRAQPRRLESTTSVLDKFSKNHPFPEQSHLQAWQICSSFAHAKSWYQDQAVEVVKSRTKSNVPNLNNVLWNPSFGSNSKIVYQAAHALAAAYRTYADTSGTELPDRFMNI